jgi:5-methylcytosine-specific restriction endonuclease McrA
MDNKRKYLDLICDTCGNDYKQQERVYKKAKWKNRCKKHRGDFIKKKRESIKKKNCIDCGTATYDTRCKPCSGKNRRIYNHDNKCLECSTSISLKSKRCLKCHNIKQDKGKSKERTKFNTSDKWKMVRELAFIRDNYTCKMCNNRGSVKLNGHHVKSYKNHPKERLNTDNIVTLCESCHLKLHHKKEYKTKYKYLLCD